MTSHSPSPDTLNLVPKLFESNGLSPRNALQKLGEYNFEFGGTKQLLSDFSRYSSLKHKPLASLYQTKSPRTEREEPDSVLDSRKLRSEHSPENLVNPLGFKKALMKQYVSSSTTPTDLKVETQTFTGRSDTLGEQITEGSLSSSRKGRTYSDMKLETYQITEFAKTFRDLKMNPNPAYELTMPKDSERLKKIKAGFHDISHLADLKAQSPSSRALQQYLDDLRRRATLAEAIESTCSNGDKDDKLSPRRFSDYLIASYENQGEAQSSVNNKKPSNFMDLPEFLSERRDTDGLVKEDLRSSAMNFTRNIKRFGSDELISQRSEYQTSYAESPWSKREAKYIKNVKKVNAVNSTPQETLDEFCKNNLIVSLKKELPNILNGVPSGRTEVLILGNWLSTQINKIKNHPLLQGKEKIRCADEVYNLTLNELVRQISCECIERGELFTKIWRNYVTLCEEIVAEAKNNFEHRLKQHIDEFNNAKKGFLAQLDGKQEEIKGLQQSKYEMELKIEHLDRKIAELELKNLNLQQTIAQTRNHFVTGQKQFRILKREFESLSYKYQKLRNEENHIDDEFDPEEIVRMKFEEVMAKQRAKEAEERLLDSESESFDEPMHFEAEKATYAFNFGAFVGKKIEYQDQEVQVDPDTENLVEGECQTELMLINPKFDVLFENMKVVENLTKEVQFKRQIEEDNIQNLEEDLQEELYEREYKRLMMFAKAQEQEYGLDISGDMIESEIDLSIYDESRRKQTDEKGTTEEKEIVTEQMLNGKESKDPENEEEEEYPGSISIQEGEEETKLSGERSEVDMEKVLSSQILQKDEETLRKNSGKGASFFWCLMLKILGNSKETNTIRDVGTVQDGENGKELQDRKGSQDLQSQTEEGKSQIEEKNTNVGVSNSN